MAAKTPWMTSRDLIASVKRKISFPISQNTFSEQDILDFANEEMLLQQVPAIMTYHEEYFVKSISTPLVSNKARYQIPDRAIALKLRDLSYMDSNNNLFEMTRVNSDDKSYWQRSFGFNGISYRFYIEGNDVVMTPNPNDFNDGSLVFYVFFRPNQLVANERAATVQGFQKQVTIGTLVDGDVIEINQVSFEAVSSSPTGTQFLIGGTPTISASNLVAVMNSNGFTTANTLAVVVVSYLDVTMTFNSLSANIVVDSTTGVVCDQIPTTYIDPTTGISSPLFQDGELIDFLQTRPGHKTRSFDIQIPTNGISGNVFVLDPAVIPTDLIAGDYICLANECIIPQIPTDLHSGLAERTCGRILAALGDQQGLQNSMAKLQEITQGESRLLDDRVDGSPEKVLARHSIVRYNKRLGFRRY